MKKKEYALYQGDEFIMIGTAEEIAKRYNTKIKNVYMWKLPVYERRNRGNNHKKIIVVGYVGEE